MKLHKGDPCEYCGLPHDEVSIGDCEGVDAPDFDLSQLPDLLPVIPYDERGEYSMEQMREYDRLLAQEAEDIRFEALLASLERKKRDKVLRMYRLWREGRLPSDVVVIEVPIERTGYGDVRFNLPDYGPPRVPDDRFKVIEVELHRCADPATGAALVLGWNEFPPRLIVGRE